jgi:predicted metal-dependent HD superfamily phosphohydrolase
MSGCAHRWPAVGSPQQYRHRAGRSALYDFLDMRSMSMNPDAISGTMRTGTIVRDALLQQRFLDLWQRAALPGTASNPELVWRELAHHYAEPHRHYHTKAHLAHCLEQLDLAGERIRHPDQVEMAIWFHDVIHRPGQTDNERRSAALFCRRAAGVMDADFITEVVELILITTHTERADDPDRQFICDIDLSSFGCPWECFLRNSDAVKAEFALPDEEFYPGERAFLGALLARPRIFLTDFFHQRYEQQARDNIVRLLELIDQRQS